MMRHSRPGQRVHVALAGGGSPYPARISREGRSEVTRRPLFTRRTVTRILRDIQAVEREYVEPRGNDGHATNKETDFHWEGNELKVTGRAVGWKSATYAPNRSGLYPLFDADDWVPAIPRWRIRTDDPSAVLRLFHSRKRHAIFLLDQLERDAPTDVLIAAARRGGYEVQERLLRLLSDRREPGTGKAIAEFLASPSASVRAEAAHALEHRGDRRCGQALLVAARSELDAAVSELMVRALVATRHSAAIPWLKGLLADPETDQRVRAAAAEAIQSLA